MQYTRRIVGDPDKALVIGEMPLGCVYCFKGLKAVVFITGLCDDKCYYCPLSEVRRGDVVFVNEEKVDSIDEIIRVIDLLGQTSASITGGDPLSKPERTLEAINALKGYFGESFHIHLYTTGRYATLDILKLLDKKGLDEIRFHPTSRLYLKRVEQAVKNTSMSVGVEIPVVPGTISYLKKLALYLEKIGVAFLNLNELEITYTNSYQLTLRGFKESKSRSPAVDNSLYTALEFLRWAEDNLSNLNIHFCPARFKDSIQTRNRLFNQALRLAKLYEKISSRGLIIKSVIEIGELLHNVVENLDLEVSADSKKLYTSPDKKTLEHIISSLNKKNMVKDVYIVEEYPYLSKRLIISRTPLTF